MQSGKSAMETVRESAANIAASAKCGLDKTKATVQEKVEKLRAHDPVEKEIATEKKEEKINQAELQKHAAHEHNAAAKQAVTGQTHTTTAGTGTGTYSTTGAHGHTTGTHQMSALPGHGAGQPLGQVTEGVVKSHPIGTNTGTGRTTAHNTRAEGNAPGYGTGGTYS